MNKRSREYFKWLRYLKEQAIESGHYGVIAYMDHMQKMGKIPKVCYDPDKGIGMILMNPSPVDPHSYDGIRMDRRYWLMEDELDLSRETIQEQIAKVKEQIRNKPHPFKNLRCKNETEL